jgi:hypothetical protein
MYHSKQFKLYLETMGDCKNVPNREGRNRIVEETEAQGDLLPCHVTQ